VSKPIVYFESLLRFDDYYDERRAYLVGVENHPNKEIRGDLVRTSAVIDAERDDDGEYIVIETENTIYVRKRDGKL
jgi:hypothetical protein